MPLRTSFLLAFSLVCVIYLSHAFPNPLSETEAEDSEYENFGNPDEWGPYFEGDMMMNEKEIDEIKSGILDESKRWPNGQVFFQYDGDFSDEEKHRISKAHKMITSRVKCVSFKERVDEDDFVSIIPTRRGCSSKVGRQGGRQTLRLAEGCFQRTGTIAHEFIHTLGFHHEQSRPDRNHYIVIHRENIRRHREGNFHRYEGNEVTTFGVSYDYGSVMHYSAYAFSKNPHRPTITVRQQAVTIGQRDDLSELDALKIRRMYGCG